jgi:V/A-type H+-transporting ATPase subunit A
LQNIIQLIGQENLPYDQQLIIFTANIIKQAYLIQSAYDSIDRYTTPQKTLKLIKLILGFHERAKKIINFVPLSKIRELNVLNEIIRAKTTISNENVNQIQDLFNKMNTEFDVLIENYKGFRSGT